MALPRAKVCIERHRTCIMTCNKWQQKVLQKCIYVDCTRECSRPPLVAMSVSKPLHGLLQHGCGRFHGLGGWRRGEGRGTVPLLQKCKHCWENLFCSLHVGIHHMSGSFSGHAAVLQDALKQPVRLLRPPKAEDQASLKD